ncbi:MAG: peptidoglycan-binding domain-containing protein [Candidatus Nomurabacteria bacterium]|nr:peptidoglycan-binding domain-containing protein [Candidatus Nomurabacteria bacterium]
MLKKPKNEIAIFEGNELVTKCHQLKMQATDCRYYLSELSEKVGQLKMTSKNNTKLFTTLILSALFLFPFLASATGNTTNYAWGENVGWANFNSTDSGVTVATAGLTGYLWLENVGWIQLDYDGVAGATNTTSTNWGIVNDGHGNLSGYAWGESVGWINFHPTDSQVAIDSSGNFTGYAWSENAGWIQFNHNQTTYKPTTVWYPRIITSSTNGNGSISPSGATSVTYNTDQTFTIIPNNGYRISDVQVDGTSQGTIASYTFSNVTDNHTISVTFARRPNGRPIISIPPSTPATPSIPSNTTPTTPPPYTNPTTTVYNFGTTTLKNGSRGEPVKELQRFLNATMNLNLTIDGKLGPKTILVIKAWQKAHGLTPDGLIGAKTKERMKLEAEK